MRFTAGFAAPVTVALAVRFTAGFAAPVTVAFAVRFFTAGFAAPVTAGCAARFPAEPAARVPAEGDVRSTVDLAVRAARFTVDLAVRAADEPAVGLAAGRRRAAGFAAGSGAARGPDDFELRRLAAAGLALRVGVFTGG